MTHCSTSRRSCGLAAAVLWISSLALTNCGNPAADSGQAAAADTNDTGGGDGSLADTTAADTTGTLQPTVAFAAPAAKTAVYPGTSVDVAVLVQQSAAAAAWSMTLSDKSASWSLSQAIQPGSNTAHFAVTVPESAGLWQIQLAAHSTAAAVELPPITLELQIDGRPTAPQISLQPDAPTVLDAVKLNVLQAASDPEGQPLQQAVQWQVDGVVAPATGALLPAGAAKKGQWVAATVLASDGHSTSAPAKAEVQVANAVPLPAVLAAAGGAVLDLTGIAATVIDQPASDPDGDAVTMAYEWQVAGEVVPGALASKHSVLELALLRKKPIAAGDLLQVRAICSDGTAKAPSQPVQWQVAAAKLCPAVQPCGAHAQCVENGTTQPGCVCEKGYVGDGQNCLKLGGPLVELADGATLTLAAAGTLPVTVGETDSPLSQDLQVTLIDLATGATIVTAAATPPNGQAALVAKVGPSGKHTLVLVVSLAGKVIWQHEYAIAVNLPPQGLAVLALSNPAPTTLDAVTATVTGGVTDSDALPGQQLTWKYQWVQVGGGKQVSGATLPALTAKKNEVWQVQVTPHDGLDGGETATASVTIGNAAPSKPKLAAKSAEVSLLGTAELVIVGGQSVDADQDPVQVTLQWQVNGVVVAGVVANSAAVAVLSPTAKQGDLITAVAMASDGVTTVSSDAVIIAVVGGDDVCASPLTPCASNALCTDNGSLQPACACPTAAFGNGLVCAAVALSQTATQVVNVGKDLVFDATLTVGKGYTAGPLQLWTLATAEDQRQVAIQPGAQKLSFAEPTPGQHLWKLALRDGKGNSLGQWPVAVYGNLPPTAPQVQIAPDKPSTAQPLTAQLTAQATDPDEATGQKVSYLYQWSIAGKVAGTAKELPAGTAKKGQSVLLTVQATDGYAEGPAAQAQVFLGNAAPPQFSVVAPAKVDLTAIVQLQLVGMAALDADGETVTCQTVWSVPAGPVGGASGPSGLQLDLLKAKRPDGKAFKVGDALMAEVSCSDGTATVTAQGGPALLQSPGIDVCAVFNPCDKNGQCLNNDTLAPACQCGKGFSGDGTTCTDIDECAQNNGGCAAQAKCTNTQGSFACLCKTGWTGDGTSCSDVNECTNGSAQCDAHADCSNTAGSYSCACKAGWTGNGSSCADVDECQTGTASCGSNATCSNTQGSWKCSCKQGFVGDGVTCNDVNECTSGLANCDSHATCINTVGNYACSCNVGWTGNGSQCADINECQSGVAKCSINATCTNMSGSYACKCNTGYIGDGVTCSQLPGTCAGKCGGLGTNGKCYCDAGCVKSGDCCSDYSIYCSTHFCDSHCNSSGTGCYCDAVCKTLGDCCNSTGTGKAGTACTGSTCSLCK